jgi:hypothetical protein
MFTKELGGLAAIACGSLGLVAWAAVQGSAPSKPPALHAATAHRHDASHGGRVEAVGNHHVEAKIEQGGRLRVFVLDEDPAVLMPIPAAELVAEAQPLDAPEFTPVRLRAKPQPGEPEGTASQFAGTLPKEIIGRPLTLALTVPLGGKRYRARFEPETHGRDPHDPFAALEHRAALSPAAGAADHGETPSMPAGAGGGSEAERALYLKPKGRYTAADIRANGPQFPSRKFQGIMATHDMNPKAGDPLCPITGTLANPKFAWTIGGQKYQFCCPPCIDEFVKQAREKPDTISPPTAYVKR